MSETTFKMNPKESDKFGKKLLSGIATKNKLITGVYSKRLLVLPKATQSKVFRYMIKNILSNGFGGNFMREYNSNILKAAASISPRGNYNLYYWNFDSSCYNQSIKLDILSEVISLIKRSGLTTKILTVNTLSHFILSIAPDEFKYLFNTGLIVLSKSIKISNTFQSSINFSVYRFNSNLSIISSASILPGNPSINSLDFVRYSFISTENTLINLRLVHPLIDTNTKSTSELRAYFIGLKLQLYKNIGVVVGLATSSSSESTYKKYNDELKIHSFEALSTDEMIYHMNRLVDEVIQIEAELDLPSDNDTPEKPQLKFNNTIPFLQKEET